MYLLDAGVIIDAADLHYPIERVPEYWGWLAHHASVGNVKVPREIFDEVIPKKTDHILRKWLANNKPALVLESRGYLSHVAAVTDQYDNGSGLTETDVERMGNDPFLIAAAMCDGTVLVTTEESKPKRLGGNRHIPDVCNDLGIRCIKPHVFHRELDFRTDWDRKSDQ
ncbi:MAG: DUF4411 family protein [Deltaproteobacteria bacterium]|nr:DUF4411 family protein [Deltaproteobacteria bacterium]